MNLLRFKSPALIELVSPAASPGIFTIPLTRDIRVVNAFAFAGAAEEGSAYQIFTVCQGVRQNISKAIPLEKNVTTYLTDIDTEWLTLRAGWTLGIEVVGATQANVYIWAIPLPNAAMK